jgi:CheY-like chemotaxis protein
MDSAYLLVIDNSPDHAQVTSSFLRNAGLAVRVVSASNTNEMEDVLKEKSPFLIIVGTQIPPTIKIGQIMQLADQYSIPTAMQVEPADTAHIESAIAVHPLMIINAEEDDQLMHVVKQNMSGGRTAREFI